MPESCCGVRPIPPPRGGAVCPTDMRCHFIAAWLRDAELVPGPLNRTSLTTAQSTVRTPQAGVAMAVGDRFLTIPVQMREPSVVAEADELEVDARVISQELKLLDILDNGLGLLLHNILHAFRRAYGHDVDHPRNLAFCPFWEGSSWTLRMSFRLWRAAIMCAAAAFRGKSTGGEKLASQKVQMPKDPRIPMVWATSCDAKAQ